MKPTSCTCEPDGEDYCPYCCRQSALRAGIPESVLDGKTKLSDHFSPEYVRSQCGQGLRQPAYPQPDIDICSECGEHAEFDENGSECCGAGSYDTDPDTDMER